MIGDIKLVYVIAVLVFTAVSSWVMGVRMRRRARRALGRKISGSELTSISTWIAVEEAEHREDPRTEPTLR